tara:strand:+ start:67 stop:537 length:471 start_codon:yes stop_codon:yes gene_type:complete
MIEDGRRVSQKIDWSAFPKDDSLKDIINNLASHFSSSVRQHLWTMNFELVKRLLYSDWNNVVERFNDMNSDISNINNKESNSAGIFRNGLDDALSLYKGLAFNLVIMQLVELSTSISALDLVPYYGPRFKDKLKAWGSGPMGGDNSWRNPLKRGRM